MNVVRECSYGAGQATLACGVCMNGSLLFLVSTLLVGCRAASADDAGEGGADDTGETGLDSADAETDDSGTGTEDSGTDTGDSGGDDTGDSGTDTGTPDRDGDGAPDGSDCAADDPTVHPGAAEAWCDGIDQDCDGGDLTTPTLTGADGVAVDVSADLASGTESAPMVMGVTDATLRVCGGTWYAGAWLSGNARVEAAGGAVFRSGPSTSALRVGSGATAVVSGLRVEDSYRGVTSTVGSGSLTLEGVELVGNASGIVWYGAASLTMRDTRVADSTTYGIWMSGGTLVVERGEIVGSGGVDAGGVSLRGSSAALTDTTITGNTATAYAGGITAITSNVKLTGVTLDNNAGSLGGAIYAYASVIEIADSVLSANVASAGGAVYADLAYTLDLRDTVMEGNTTTGDGAAMVVLSSTSTVERVVFQDNVAGNVATVVAVGSQETYVDADFLDNAAYSVPAHFAQRGGVRFTGGTFARNAADVVASGLGFTTVLCGQDTTFDAVSVGSAADVNTPPGFYDASTEYFELTTVTTSCPNGECDIGSTVWCGI